jgi:hypothetical protein
VGELPCQVGLRLKAGKSVVAQCVAHAACPPSYGGVQVEAGDDVGRLVVTNAQPCCLASRRTLKVRSMVAAAGWTCSDAVACMVLPHSVVEE